MKPGFFFKEAFRALSRNAAPSLAALVTIVLTALVLGVFIPVVQATTGTANDVRQRVVVDVFIKADSTDAQRTELRKALIATPNVRQVSFVSKDEALRHQTQRNKDAFELLGRNPLPDVFRLTPQDPDGVNAIVDRVAPRGAGGVRHPRLAGVDEVRNREHDTNKILKATGLVKLLTASLAILFTFASIALVANTIRLSLYARRREIEVMKLVGATNWFIRWPFVIEGIFVGLMGGVIAALMLVIAKTALVDPLASRFALLATPNTIDFGLLIGLLMAACVLVSSLGSGITLRRFLRV
ncbi:MAG: cell division transport system permease protein [Thermoleophilaceae bacterium]|nr:cell division transport system permease protein [Thermoleophilaceae bacterium]